MSSLETKNISGKNKWYGLSSFANTL